MQVRFWWVGLCVGLAPIAVAAAPETPARYSYEISWEATAASKPHISLQMTFLPDKVVLKGEALKHLGGCTGPALTIPRNGQAERQGPDQGISAAGRPVAGTVTATATYAVERNEHRIRIVTVSRFPGGDGSTTVEQVNVRLDDSCRLDLFSYGYRDDKKNPGAQIVPDKNTGTYKCVQLPVAAFDQDRCNK
ncbi:MAG: hypothetical protein NTV97_08275 [Alphaproteobacteria bacterium]|nr:hypothetical protein [Alphaproteobacteria bacterium]